MCNKRMVQKEKIKGGRIMKITNKKKFIVRILELITIIATIILTIVFSLIVMFMMHRKLKKVNMIDALKSNE